MLCSYESGNQCAVRQEGRCPDGFSRCLNGMMILVGIIAGLVMAAGVVLLFLNGFLPTVFPAALTMLITGIVSLLLVTTAALFLPREADATACLRCHLGGLFFGLLGLIVSSLLAVMVDTSAGSVAAAVTLGLSAFFMAYLLVSLLFVVISAVRR